MDRAKLNRTTLLLVEGMMCQKNCGSTVQRALEAVPGVESAVASHPKANAIVVWNASASPNVIALISALDDCGFDARPISETAPDHILSVVGMMCQKNCGSTAQRALMAVDGVTWAEASFAQSNASIWGTSLSVPALIEALEDVGFDAAPTESETSASGGAGGEPDTVLEIPTMCSEACAKTVRETLLSVDGVMSIEPQLEYNAIFVYGFADAASMISALTEIGYPCTEGSYHGMTRKDMKSALASMKQGKNSTHPSKSKASSRKSSGTAFDQPVQSFQSSGSSAGTHFAEFRVSGMSCAACVRAVEGGVIKQAGVVSVRVALLAEKAEVIYNGFRVQGMEIADAITTLGYTAKLITERKVSEVTKREYKFTVDGRALMDHTMNGRIEDTIQALGGICSVQIDGMAHAVNVVVDDKLDGSAGPRDIIEAIEGLGCAASLADDANALNGDGEDGSAEVNSWGRLLCISMMLGIPVMVLHMTMKHSKALMMAIDQPAICDGAVSTMQIVMLLLNLPLQFGVGYRFYRAAFLGALHGNFGMDALVVTGTTITFVYSVVSLLMSCATGMPSKHVFFEASGMLLMFVTMGKFFEAYAKGRSVNAITNLLKLQPTQALLVEKTAALSSSDSAATTTVTNAESVPTGNRFYGSMTDDSKPMSPSKDTDALYVTSPSSSSHGGGGSSTSPFGAQESVRPIALALVQRGDIVKVLPGARLPTDGIILSGSSYVDESMITGESVPQMRRKDDLVFGSTVNQNGCLYVQVKSVGADSALAQIVKLVENAQMEKAPVQAYADKIAAVFTPIVLTLAFLTFSAWACAAYMHAIPEGWYTEEYGDPVLFSMLFGISVVVISCPCALGLATPTAIMVGTSVGANNGVLIKGGPAFEMAHKIDTVILDKTGTLTEGKPSLIDEVVFDESLKVVQDSIDPVESEALCEQKDRILQLAASVEQGSEHPLAQAVMQAAKNRRLSLIPAGNGNESGIEVVPGQGVRGQTAKGTVLVGNRQFMETHELAVTPTVDATMWDLEVQGKTAVCVALEGRILGILGIADVCKDEAFRTLIALRSMNLDVWMVTGDNRTTAEAIAEELDIPKDRVVAGVMPADKVSKVKSLQEMGRCVAMVGDGINDSPALACANLGIAVGAGTHVAVDAADMVLVRSNLADVVVALDLAKVVFHRIRCNFIWALMYNVVAIPFAAGVWFPWTQTLVPPQYAGLSMALSSVSVVLSSMSLRLYKRPKILEDPDLLHATMDRRKRGSIWDKAKRGLRNVKDKLKSSVGAARGHGSGSQEYRPVSVDEYEDDFGLQLGSGGSGGNAGLQDARGGKVFADRRMDDIV